MNARTTDFEALAQGAAHCREFGGSFVLYVGNEVHDSYRTLDEAADMLVDFWANGEPQKILEFSPSGLFTDVTDEACKRVEKWCAERFETAPWDDVEAETEESNHDFQRSVAYMSGHFS